MVAHPFIVIPINSLVAPVHTFKIFIRKATAGSNARDHEVVTAEYLRHLVDHVSIQAADGRPDGDYRRHADDDSNQRQKSPQLVSKNRLDRNLQGVSVKGKKGFHSLVQA